MILIVDPAALGGLAGLVIFAGWAVGRAQGSLRGDKLPRDGIGAGAEPPNCDSPVPDAQPPSAIASAPCQQRALEERRAVLAWPFALAELHAEASAIRRDERIFDDMPSANALIMLTRTAPGAECRFIGLSGQPTCPSATRVACPDGGACRAQGALGVHRPQPDRV